MSMLAVKNTNVTIMVSNLDRAIAFYTEILGMELKGRYGDHWADIKGPGISIGLHPTEKEMTRSDNLQIALGVSNIREAIEALRSSGVEVKDNSEEMVKLATFHDPDGNTLYVVQSEW